MSGTVRDTFKVMIEKRRTPQARSEVVGVRMWPPNVTDLVMTDSSTLQGRRHIKALYDHLKDTIRRNTRRIRGIDLVQAARERKPRSA